MNENTPLPSSNISNLVKALWIVLMILALPIGAGIGYMLYNANTLPGGGLVTTSSSITSSYVSTATPFTVQVINPVLNVAYQRTQFYFKASMPIAEYTLPDGWKGYLSAAKDEIIVESKKLSLGEHSYMLVFQSEEGQSTNYPLSFKTKKKLEKASYWANSEFTFTPDSFLSLANKRFRLPMYYKPTDLVTLASYNIKNYNSAQIRRVAVVDLVEMTKAISKAGIDYHITSGYRSFGSQVSVYNYWLNLSNGDIAYTDSFSARPGHSEHQLGTTIDFLTKENGETFYKFEDTRLAKWLASNAHKYGFVKSYPKNKESITGYKFEPWHYRYIGKENVPAFRESKLTLTEWLYEQNNVEMETL